MKMVSKTVACAVRGHSSLSTSGRNIMRKTVVTSKLSICTCLPQTAALSVLSIFKYTLRPLPRSSCQLCYSHSKYTIAFDICFAHNTTAMRPICPHSHPAMPGMVDCGREHLMTREFAFSVIRPVPTSGSIAFRRASAGTL
jgi:hypothetical protein